MVGGLKQLGGGRTPLSRIARAWPLPSSSGRRIAERGFTLVEVTITVAILALVMAVVIPSVSSVGWARLRSSASKLAGLVRQTYDEAALTGQTYRLVFDFESGKVHAESTSQVLNFEAESNALVESAKQATNVDAIFESPDDFMAGMEDPAKSEEAQAAGKQMDMMSALLGVNRLTSMGGMAGEEAFTQAGPVLELKNDARLVAVWIQGMEKPQTEGKAYLYFFPHGYTMDALVHLEEDTDDDKDPYTVKVSALTGKAVMVPEYVEPPRS